MSTDLDAGARGCAVSKKADPSSKESASGGAVARRMSSRRQVLLGQYGATNKICSSSSLILHSVCASRLTEGAHICTGPGASCVPVHPCRALPWVGSRTTGSESSPNQLNRLGMESPLPWKCCSRQLVGCLIEHSRDVDSTKGPQLLTPEEVVTGEL